MCGSQHQCQQLLVFTPAPTSFSTPTYRRFARHGRTAWLFLKTRHHTGTQAHQKLVHSLYTLFYHSVWSNDQVIKSQVLLVIGWITHSSFTCMLQNAGVADRENGAGVVENDTIPAAWYSQDNRTRLLCKSLHDNVYTLFLVSHWFSVSKG